MFQWLWGLLKKKSPEDELKGYLQETRKVKVQGLTFKIRRLNMYDYLDGSKTLTNYYALYQAGKTKEAEQSIKKVQAHYRDVFMSAVVKPRLTRKNDPNDDAVWVDEITENLVLASQLYTEIVSYTDGVKKKTWGDHRRA